MFLQTLGSLILVAGASYHLVTASWQVILLSFVVAGVGYAAWTVRKALIRRAKIKALWKRSIEIDEMLDALESENQVRQAVLLHAPGDQRRTTGRTCVALEGPAKLSIGTTGSGTTSTSAVDPSTRVYKFSMKALAESRTQPLQQQQVPV